MTIYILIYRIDGKLTYMEFREFDELTTYQQDLNDYSIPNHWINLGRELDEWERKHPMDWKK